MDFELTPSPRTPEPPKVFPLPEIVVTVAVPRPLFEVYTYGATQEQAELLVPGRCIQVHFGRKKTHAYVVDKPIPAAEYVGPVDLKKIKPIENIEAVVIPEDLRLLASWAADYYHAPLGEALQAVLPAAAIGLRSLKKEPRIIERKTFEPLPLELSPAQEKVFQKIEASSLSTSLLHGVTGSGKTEIYLRLIREYLNRGQSVILMVPEIALTPQLHRRLELGIGETVAMWHSALANGKRRDLWHAMNRGEIRVVVGARSAVFVPVKGLGLVLVDEEHEASYKQEDRFRYNARDLAIVRANRAKAKVILGSATPSLESLEAAKLGRYHYVQLDERFSNRSLPAVKTVDMTKVPTRTEAGVPMAEEVLIEIRETLAKDEQVLIFLNRRGFANFLLCEDCGEVTECENCSVSMTVHRRGSWLKCHLCGDQRPRPDKCPKCSSFELKVSGGGTERLEEMIPKWISSAKVVRLDRDKVTSTKKLEQILDEFRSGEANILLGTQMLVKGHDFAGVTLVVVVSADSLLHWPDFRAPERALQTLTQVSGRAGRGEKPGRVLIQTYQPDHPVLNVLKGEISTDDFLAEELELRQELSYPPFGRLIRMRVEAGKQDDARKPLEFVRDELEKKFVGQIQVLGPSEAVVERVNNIYRWDLLLKSTHLKSLHQAASLAARWAEDHKVQLSVDVDPQSMG